MGNTQEGQSNGNGEKNPSDRPARPAPLPPAGPMYPSLGNGDRDFVMLPPAPPGGSGPPPVGPPKRALRPPPPVPSNESNTHTLGTSLGGLDGVPFVINPKFLPAGAGGNKPSLPQIRAKTMDQICREYNYPFTVEREI